ncbi:hypothetical protein F2P56_010663 [Juglans regia]|uniref:Retroviral polymerase SH3-like domain-containing protein n=1 Tax=Juglans regia TaxID=51240 RepID=A0A833XQK7_JUGRE|nr:hypothetical protein F2P56_010663 [Juglans regia]
MPSSVLDGSSLFSILFPSFPPFTLPPKIFGYVCYVHSFGPGFDKLDPRSTKCFFVGYSRTQKGYRCYSHVLRRYFMSANVTFFESISYFFDIASSVECDPLPLPNLTLSPPIASPPPPPPLPVPLQVYSHRSWLPASMPSPIMSPFLDLELSSISDSPPIALCRVQDALCNMGWRTAMKDEMDALRHNETWDLVPLPPAGC